MHFFNLRWSTLQYIFLIEYTGMLSFIGSVHYIIVFLFCFIIQIFDGIYENQELLGTFCGYGLPPHIRSIGHSMSIQFVTDSSMGGIGFKLVYFQGNVLKDERKNLTSVITN